ncbi:uncharacterized protein LOC101848964 [Aplysia californica]|uniref:Uncharacterized protein LOC101848964 n=1 Tax=Aplysia californica TaxID=6500 RepID=A0ABM0JLR9_APLCA|nr:uncharacterized protein LOC101848964 [Aplysia californica]
MEALRQARNLYIKSHDYETSLSDVDKPQLKSDIQRFIAISLKESALQNIFANPCMLNVLNTALRDRAANNTDLAPVVKAFESLERYILLLVEQPWKPEYKKLKMYGGFYKTRIKSVLLYPEEIFFTAGYIATNDDVMVHKRQMDKASLLLLAFDCKIASVECKTIADHYSKVKNIGQSLGFVVSERLGDAGIREENLLGRGKAPVPEMDLSWQKEMRTAAPALPKRDPIHHTRSHQQRAFESAYATGLEAGLDGVELSHKQGSRFNGMRPYQDFGHLEQVKSPLPASESVQDSFPCIDTALEERIPELPQGTCDEHMRESLKFVSQEEGPRHPPSTSSHTSQGFKSNDWKWFRELQNNGHVPRNTTAPVPEGPQLYGQIGTSNPLSVNTYPPAVTNYKPSMYPNDDASLDEGFQTDLGGSSRFLQPSLQGSFSQVAAPVQQVPHGYQVPHAVDATYGLKGIPPQPQGSFGPTIYTPPVLDADSAMLSYASKQARAPPPIPSRALKPMLQTRPMRADNMLENASVTAASLQAADLSRKVYGTLSAPTLPNMRPPVPVQTSDTEPITRRDRFGAGGKSNSLKYGDEKTSAVYKVAQSRAARSMDMTLIQWKCTKCSNVNMASDAVCSVCTHSRLSTTKKSCPRCTFDNSVESTHCGLCHQELEDQYTYV